MNEHWLLGLDHKLSSLEYSLKRAGSAKVVSRELSRYLSLLHHRVLARSRQADPSMHEALHSLIRRCHSINSAQNARDLIRDIRQFQLVSMSASRTQDMEARVREL